LEIGHLHQLMRRIRVAATLRACGVSRSTYTRWLRAQVEAPARLLAHLHDAGHLTDSDVAGLLRHGLSRTGDA